MKNLDFDKIEFKDKPISMKESLEDIEPFVNSERFDCPLRNENGVCSSVNQPCWKVCDDACQYIKDIK